MPLPILCVNDITSAADFLHPFFEDSAVSGMYGYIWRLKTRRSQWFQIDPSAGFPAIPKDERDVYFGLCPTAGKGTPVDRATADTASALTCLWVDIDIGPVGHKKSNLPPSLEVAMNTLLASGVCPAPSLTVDSGHGVHCYWLLENAFVINTPILRTFAIKAVDLWNKAMRKIFKAKGWELDSTSLAQIMRLPFTVNGKEGLDVPATVHSGTLTRHPLSELHSMACAYLNDAEQQAPVTFDTPEGTLAEQVRVAAYDIKVRAGARLSDEDLEAFMEDKVFRGVWSGKRAYPSQSERDLALAAVMLSMGASPQEVVNGIIHMREINKASLKRPDYYERTLIAAERARINSKSEVLQLQARSKTPEGRTRSIQEAQELLGFPITEMRKFLTMPPTYRIDIDVNGRVMRLQFTSIKELRSQTYFLDRLMEASDAYIKPMGKKGWEKFCALILPLFEHEDMGKTGTGAGAFLAKLNKYLDYSTMMESYQDAMSHPVRVDDVVFIDAEDFQMWHNREGIYDKMKLEQVAVMFAEIGAKSVATPNGERWAFKVKTETEVL